MSNTGTKDTWCVTARVTVCRDGIGGGGGRDGSKASSSWDSHRSFVRIGSFGVEEEDDGGSSGCVVGSEEEVMEVGIRRRRAKSEVVVAGQRLVAVVAAEGVVMVDVVDAAVDVAVRRRSGRRRKGGTVREVWDSVVTGWVRVGSRVRRFWGGWDVWDLRLDGCL